MMKLADFQNRAEMEAASVVFLDALRGKPVPAEKVNTDEWLACGHAAHNGRRYGNGEALRCRICEAEKQRIRRMPDRILDMKVRIKAMKAQEKCPVSIENAENKLRELTEAARAAGAIR